MTTLREMKCFHPQCNAGPANNTTLFRINAKGRPGIWACRIHRKNTDAPIDADLDELVEIIEKRPTR